MYSASDGRARMNLVLVVQDDSARSHQLQVAIHRVLIERDEQVELVTDAQQGLSSYAQCQEDVSATDNGLIGVVRLEVQSASHEDARQDVARRGDALPRRATNSQ